MKNDVATLKISRELHQAVRAFCKQRGLLMQPWVERALLDALRADKGGLPPPEYASTTQSVQLENGDA